MKKFLAVYTGTPAAMTAWNSLSESERAQRQVEGMAAWHKWAADNASVIDELGGPLGKTTQIGKEGISEIGNNLSGFSIVQAESQAAAAQLFIQHPHFTIFPGAGVEVMEIMSVPH